MKTKNLRKRLTLNKRTVATLEDDKMKKVWAGMPVSEGITGCPSCTFPTNQNTT